MKLTQSLSIALLGALSLNNSALAAQERWFEIEVILFSQLGDKALLKEDFSVDLPAVKLNKPRDLLSQYISPDLSAIKASIPVCGEAYPLHYLEQSAIIESEFNVNTLQEIEQRALTSDEIFEFQQKDQEFITNQDRLSFDPSYTDEGYQAVESVDDLFAQETEQLVESEEDIFISSLTQEEQEALLQKVEQANTYFEQQQFSYHYDIPESVCLLSDEVINELSQNVAGYQADYFNLATMPNKILRNEDLYSTTPYLLNDDSLKLQDIALQLKRSKNFKPLLHVGWRQPAISKRRSKPMRLFAGENFAYAHQQAMSEYNAQLASQLEEKMNEQSMLDTLSDLSDAQMVANEPHPFYHIIDTLNDNNISEEQALESLEQETLAQADDTLALIKPLAPEVDWTIDGLFNVHLNHYLYITAEFNVADKTLAQHQTALLSDSESQVKAIRFSQNRRVISKEIHYFDHPYMGMLVQIRRYKVPSRPESE